MEARYERDGEDYGVPDGLMQLIRERPHGGKVRPKYVVPDPSGWTVLDRSQLAFFMTPNASSEGAGVIAGSSNEDSASEPESKEEVSEWARFAPKRKTLPGGLGNGAISGRQLKQHQQDALVRQKVKLAIVEARVGRNSTVKRSPPPPKLSFDPGCPRSPGIVRPADSRQLKFTVCAESEGYLDPTLSEEFSSLIVEGAELVTSPDVMFPVRPALPGEKCGLGQGGKGNLNRSEALQHKKQPSSEVVIVPWSFNAQQGRQVETVAYTKPNKEWL